MILNKEILICVTILFVAQIVIWFQLNGQIKWEWFKDNYFLMSLMGIPISYMLLVSTKFGFQGFGTLWPIRLMGFATGMISFPIITYLVLGEGITLKTAISILLAIVIMILQFI